MPTERLDIQPDQNPCAAGEEGATPDISRLDVPDTRRVVQLTCQRDESVHVGGGHDGMLHG